MIKNTIPFLFAAFIGLTSFNIESFQKEMRDVTLFQSVEVGSGIDLYLKQGDVNEVEVECEKAIMHRIYTEVNAKGALVIKAQSNTRWTVDKAPRVYVTYQVLKAISTSGGSDVRGNGVNKGKKVNITAFGGSDVYFNVECDTLIINASGGSDVKVAGKSQYLNADASSGSDINALDLESYKCRIVASGGSDAYVNVVNELFADASGGSDIGYSGNPPIKEINESGGSDVYRK
jgi:hypothetical protein